MNIAHKKPGRVLPPSAKKERMLIASSLAVILALGGIGLYLTVTLA